MIAGLALLGVVALSLAVSWTHAPWRDFVRRKPASYVELTIVQPSALPTTFVSGSALAFGFSIRNVDAAGSHRTVTWTTSVRDTVTGKSVVAERGSRVAPAGSTETINERVTVTGTHRTEVIVALGSGQQIDFYVTAPGGAGPG